MVHLFAWPQLGTAAALVTAVAVVLNPVMPVLPDITVPALFPPASGQRSLAPAAAQPPAAAVSAVPMMPPLATPAVPVVSAASRPGPGIPPSSGAGPTVVAASSVRPEPSIEIPLAPAELSAAGATAGLVPRVAGAAMGMAPHSGDRPLPETPRPFGATLNGPRPLPAAAVDAPGTPTPADGTARSPGRVASVRPDATDPAPRGHRSPTDPN